MMLKSMKDIRSVASEGVGQVTTSEIILGALTLPMLSQATFIQSTRMQQFFENHLNPVMLVFMR